MPQVSLPAMAPCLIGCCVSYQLRNNKHHVEPRGTLHCFDGFINIELRPMFVDLS
jgi:hypothetical protein